MLASQLWIIFDIFLSSAMLCSTFKTICCRSYRTSVHALEHRRNFDSRSLKESFEVKNASSLFLFDSAKFGVDMALAESLMNTGDLKHAEWFANEAIKIAEETEEPYNIYAAYAEGILAEVKYNDMEYKDASDHYRRALVAYEMHYKSRTGPEQVRGIGAAQLLSHVYMATHDYEKAAECLELELDFSKVTYSTDSLETANVMINLASALFYSDHFDEAEIHYTNALAIYNAHSGSGKEIPSPKPFALIYTGLGDINYLRGKELAAMNNYLQLEELLGEPLQHCSEAMEENEEEVVGQEFPQEARFTLIKEHVPALHTLSMIKWRIGDMEDAQRRLKKILKLLEQDEETYGERHPQSLLLKQKLVDLHKDMAEKKYGY